MDILKQKQEEFIENTNKFKELIEVNLRKRLDQVGFIDISNYSSGMLVRVFADDFELHTDEHIASDIENDNFVYDENSCVDIILKHRTYKVAEFTIGDERQLHIINNILYEIRG